MSPLMPLKTSRKRVFISSKFQGPSSKEIPSPKLQYAHLALLVFGNWTLDLFWSFESGAWSFLGRGSYALRQFVYLAGGIACPETVVNVHYRHAAAATVQHAQQCGKAAEARPVTDAGRHSDYWPGNQ